MAKHPLSSKHFFTLVVLSVAVLGTMLMTFASQQKTSTQSEAGLCRPYPVFSYLPNSTTATDYDVTYVFRVKNTNTCSTPIEYIVYADTPNLNWKEWYKKNSGTFTLGKSVTGKLEKGEGHTIKIKVSPPSTAANKTYEIFAHACNKINIDMELHSGGKCADSFTLHYVKNTPERPYYY